MWFLSALYLLLSLSFIKISQTVPTVRVILKVSVIFISWRFEKNVIVCRLYPPAAVCPADPELLVWSRRRGVWKWVTLVWIWEKECCTTRARQAQPAQPAPTPLELKQRKTPTAPPWANPKLSHVLDSRVEIFRPWHSQPVWWQQGMRCDLSVVVLLQAVYRIFDVWASVQSNFGASSPLCWGRLQGFTLC